jgi:hypothetical protein
LDEVQVARGLVEVRDSERGREDSVKDVEPSIGVAVEIGGAVIDDRGGFLLIYVLVGGCAD